jgi:hypothetical protein
MSARGLAMDVAAAISAPPPPHTHTERQPIKQLTKEARLIPPPLGARHLEARSNYEPRGTLN